MARIGAAAEQQQGLCLLQQRSDRMHVPRGVEACTQGRDIEGQGSAEIMRLLTCHRMANVNVNACQPILLLGKGAQSTGGLELNSCDYRTAVACIRGALGKSPLRCEPAMSKDRSRLLALIACVIVARVAAASASIRGVDPEIASRYSSQLGAFACLSGGKTVPADRVNDNYCDCADGSDEPGNGPLPLADHHGFTPVRDESKLPAPSPYTC